MYPRALPVGDAAFSFELGEGIDPTLNARVRALDRALLERPFPGLVEAIPTYRSLLVMYEPSVVSFADARTAVLARLPAASEAVPQGPLRVIPTVYDGEDLDDVARTTGLSRRDVVRLHSGREYTAFMLGFAPGFAYLGSLDAALATSRRATPRVRVPAGSVAIAGRQTGIYPGGTAGGWHLIGRTSRRLFDPEKAPPSLLLPGNRVRFQAVATLPDATAALRSARRATPAIEVVDAGVLTTLQDQGRRGQRRYGVSGAGAVDARALAAANAVVGNDEAAAALECTVAGPTLRFLAPVRFAVAGADLGAVLVRSDLGDWPVPIGTAVLARAGNVLAFRERRSGCRAYVALAGGLDVPAVLGSRSTDLTGGFGGLEGRALRAGDTLGLRSGTATSPAQREAESREFPAGAASVRVVLGPQHDHFSSETLERFASNEWAVLPTSDRVACRLSGPRLVAMGPAEIVSDGMLPGCIQVPPDGQPIVMLAESPTTGGYPKIATVVTADLPELAQLVPGEGRVRFEAVAP
jgi:KipI family sensor histidine kinase inhibitor